MHPTSKFSFGSAERSNLSSRQGSVAKLGFQPYKKPTLQKVNEVQESPDSLPQISFADIENMSKRLAAIKLDATMESQQALGHSNHSLQLPVGPSKEDATQRYREWA